MRRHKVEPLPRVSVPHVVSNLWIALDTAVSLSCFLLLKYGEVDQLIRKAINPSSYLSAKDFYLDYQAIKILAKYPDLKNPLVDKRRVAEKQFIDCEMSCKATNHKLRFRFSDGAYKASPLVDSIFMDLPKIVSRILGDCPSLDDLSCGFGPGASFSTRGDTSVYQKLRSNLHGTFIHDAPFMTEFFQSYPNWISSGGIELARGSELTFVPKDAKTDRPICIEPLLNGFIQKGIGTYVRNRLKLIGCDLKNQTLNQQLSRVAITKGLSTVDLKSASDTISYMLVLHVLPEPWLHMMDRVRSPSYYYQDVWRDFEKFSSMGNAYTFELESLIFLSIAKAVCTKLGLSHEYISVYGDDVIIPREAYDTFREVCQYCGFTINEDKTFVSGPFFESCGTDWFLGCNVRPFFLKKSVKTLEERFHITNGILSIYERAKSLSSSSDLDTNRIRSLFAVFNGCVGNIPLHHRYRVPYHFGDIGIHSTFDGAKPARHDRFCGHVFYGLGFKVEKTVGCWALDDALYALEHRGLSVDTVGLYNYDSASILSEGYVHRLSRRKPKRSRYFVPTGKWNLQG